ncbi:MAG: hypothetical protein AB7H90_06125 [Alphaproteobacteria bacterium]
MKKLFKYGAVAGIFLLSAGSAALAQDYNPNWRQGSGQDWNQRGWNQSGMPDQGWHRGGMQDQGWRQGGWDQDRRGWTQGSGSTQQGGMQGPQGWGGPTAQDAYQELSKFGYDYIQGMERVQGWEARATRNGERVHVFIDDDGMIATYRGTGH